MNNNDLLVDIKNLRKSFEHKEVVHGIDFQIKKGEIFGFLGPNGSGKTTSIRMICGLLKPDAGSGQCLGYDIIKEADQIKNKVGYMTQSFSLYSDLTARENLEFFARVHQAKNYQSAIENTFQCLNFDKANQKKLTGKLSGGWKQRLALAAAIFHQPELLLLDEPTSGVDPQARRDFWDEIHELSHQGITTLVSTHYMDEAEHCHRLMYIAEGEKIAFGTVNEIISQSGLFMWEVIGENIMSLSHDLRLDPHIEQATMFGKKLHVLGKNKDTLQRAIIPYQTEAYLWQEKIPTLEDIFIYLVAKSKKTKDPEACGYSR
jgi:ABC-2 type transport system ATP-binding protein